MTIIAKAKNLLADIFFFALMQSKKIWKCLRHQKKILKLKIIKFAFEKSNRML